MSAFKVGDKVRRKPEFRDGDWLHGDAVLRVSEVDAGCIRVSATYGWWSHQRFEPADTVEEDQLAKLTAELAEAKEILAFASHFDFDTGWTAYAAIGGHWVVLDRRTANSYRCVTQAEAIAKCREGK